MSVEQNVSSSQVKVGQLWRDNDYRSRHREGEILDVDETHATVWWGAGNKTRVRLDRFRPNSTGYALVRDVE